MLSGKSEAETNAAEAGRRSGSNPIRSRERFVMRSVQLALARQDVKEHEGSESSQHNQTDCDWSNHLTLSHRREARRWRDGCRLQGGGHTATPFRSSEILA